MASGRVILDTTPSTFLKKTSIRISSSIPASNWINNWVSYPEIVKSVPYSVTFGNINNKVALNKVVLEYYSTDTDFSRVVEH